MMRISSLRIIGKLESDIWQSFRRRFASAAVLCRTSQANSDKTEHGPTGSTTFAEDEVRKFSQLAHQWWNENGEFSALHTMNDLRIPFIRNALEKEPGIDLVRPLKNLKLLDVGCGGGILSEPLARLGAQVTGVDASEENIMVARQHYSQDPELEGHIRYECRLVEDLAEHEAGQYDGIVASEIIEHVANPDLFVSACCALAKPGGSLFFTTINRTWLSSAIAIFAAERIFRIVPAGTHDWNKFVSPEELKTMLQKHGVTTTSVEGMTMNPLNHKWCWIGDTSMNYALRATKPANDI